MSIAESVHSRPTDSERRPAAVEPAFGHRRRRLQLVSSGIGAVDASALFAAARPCDDRRFVPARCGNAVLDAGASATAALLAEGLEALDPVGRASVLGRWRAHRHDGVGRLVIDEGCDLGIGCGAVTERGAWALFAWLPLAVADLTLIESGLFRTAPIRAVMLLLRPPTIWPLDDAVRAARLVPGGPHFEQEWFAALERHAAERVRAEHLVRVRASLTRIVAQLPIAGYPFASSTVGAGCNALVDTDELCAAMAARQLARYATSAVVAHALRA